MRGTPTDSKRYHRQSRSSAMSELTVALGVLDAGASHCCPAMLGTAVWIWIGIGISVTLALAHYIPAIPAWVSLYASLSYAQPVGILIQTRGTAGEDIVSR